MKRKFNPSFITGLLLVMLISAACNPIKAPSTPTTVYGESGEMGQGTVRTYAELNADGSPVSLGIVYTQALLEGLPTEPNMKSRCFDVNGNGTLDMGECIGDYELILSMPPEVTQNSEIPFQHATLNWNAHGHPPAIWGAPHFDFHFYMISEEEVQAIRPGTCGAIINCDDFKRATTPVPAPYVPANYHSVGDAVAAMGDHLVDAVAPELQDPPEVEFTHSFIYGAYDGHISFYEPMITRDYLLGQPDECKAVSLPEAWEISGYYPTEYCIHYHAERQETTVSLEKFVYREAS
ncbi:MAG: hypothetical protein DYG89_14915 [Caldilinea sp. CFX5]|nr:hypothetical protein [Caldilinea sp. CFX5]